MHCTSSTNPVIRYVCFLLTAAPCSSNHIPYRPPAPVHRYTIPGLASTIPRHYIFHGQHLHDTALHLASIQCTGRLTTAMPPSYTMAYDPSTGKFTVSNPPSVALPRQRKRDLAWLIPLALLVPPLPMYLDGASRDTFTTFFTTYVFCLLFCSPLCIVHIIWVICYLMRSKDSRELANPMRRRLWVKNPEGKKLFEDAHQRMGPAGTRKPEINSEKPTEKPLEKSS